ncbi:hypothetical protein FPSM_01703 [Flavobacterium psychrophilum]|nr:hypothetical protein FPSM_01703 [Flavobacterium psychrophilum]
MRQKKENAKLKFKIFTTVLQSINYILLRNATKENGKCVMWQIMANNGYFV